MFHIRFSESQLPPAATDLVGFELMDPSSHPCSKQCMEGHLAVTIFPIKDHNSVLEVKVKDYRYEEFFFNVLFKMDKQNMLFLGSSLAAMTDIDDGTFDLRLTFFRRTQREIVGPLYFRAQFGPSLEEA